MPRLYIVTYLFKFYAEYIMQNTRLDESQAGIKIAGRNISNLRYADVTTLMAKCEEELKSLLMSVKEKSKRAGLKVTKQTNKKNKKTQLRSWHLTPLFHGT